MEKICALCQNNNIFKKNCFKTQFHTLFRPFMLIVAIVSQLPSNVQYEH